MKKEINYINMNINPLFFSKREKMIYEYGVTKGIKMCLKVTQKLRDEKK